MVVRLDLERDGQSVADRDDAGVLARALAARTALCVGSVLSSGRECLYEQCSLHSALTMPSSVNVGSRPSMSTRRRTRRRQSVFAISAGVISGSPGVVRRS